MATEITETIRHIPVEVPLCKAEGMPKPCVVNFDREFPRGELPR